MTDYPIQCSWAVAVVYSIVVWLAGIGTASLPITSKGGRSNENKYNLRICAVPDDKRGYGWLFDWESARARESA